MKFHTREQSFHFSQIIRLLTQIIDDDFLSSHAYFKGGTCASMLDLLDRFSVDLDFDLKRGTDKSKMDKSLRAIFDILSLKAKKESRQGLFYALKYPSVFPRRSLKLSITDEVFKANKYEKLYLPEIDRYANCQTAETMFSNKLAAFTDRYRKYHTIAGRDLYDIHHFFTKNLAYSADLIKERTGMETRDYFKYLNRFISDKISNRIITGDLNYLLPKEKIEALGKTLKTETLFFLKQEIG